MNLQALSVLFFAVACVTALPYTEDVTPLPGTLNFDSAMEALDAFAKGKMADIMGGEKATDQFNNLARMLGAGPGKAGEMSTIIRDVFNGVCLWSIVNN
jgi:hypothetical protein